VDFDRGTLFIHRNLIRDGAVMEVKETKTAKSRRTITLTTLSLEALQEHRKAMLAQGFYAPDRPVFCNTEGGYLRGGDVDGRSFKPILKRAGLPHFRPYDTRHSMATLLLVAGESLKVVSERLGHANASMTINIYQHVTEGLQKQAAGKLDAILRAASKEPQREQG